MRIRGAVLERIGDSTPYADSRPIEVVDVDLAAPQVGEVLVRIERAGVCHSDLSVVDGNRVRPVPMLLGHEAAGVVEECGPGATLQPGQRVVMTFLPRCGECEGCRSGGIRPCLPGSRANEVGELLGGGSRLSRAAGPLHHHLGVSAFATCAVVDERSVVPVDADVPPDVAALLGCAVLTGGGALLNAAPPCAGQTVAVVGLGGVGLAAVLTAAAQADVRVVAVDPIESKRAAARQCGAHEVFTPQEALAAGVRADVVIEAAGSARAFESAVDLTGPGGATVTVGLPAPDARASISPLALVGGGRRIIGSYLGSAVPRRDVPVFADLWRAGRLPVERLVSDVIDLEDINVAMDRLRDGTALRQIIDLSAAAAQP